MQNFVDMEPLVIYKQEFLGRSFTFALSGNVELLTLKVNYQNKLQNPPPVLGVNKPQQGNNCTVGIIVHCQLQLGYRWD